MAFDGRVATFGEGKGGVPNRNGESSRCLRKICAKEAVGHGVRGGRMSLNYGGTLNEALEEKGSLSS